MQIPKTLLVAMVLILEIIQLSQKNDKRIDTKKHFISLTFKLYGLL